MRRQVRSNPFPSSRGVAERYLEIYEEVFAAPRRPW
jgi:hypothetical protein